MRIDDSRLTARLHEGQGGTYLWILNPARVGVRTTIRLPGRGGPYGRAEVRWGKVEPVVHGDTVTVSVPGRDGVVIRLAR